MLGGVEGGGGEQATGAQPEDAGTMQRRQRLEGQRGHSKEEEGEATDQESWSHPTNWLTLQTQTTCFHQNLPNELQALRIVSILPFPCFWWW